MKKIFNNKQYDTDTATLKATYKFEFGPSDAMYFEESLYQKRTGEFFLHGKGNGMSRYAERVGDAFGQGERIMPLTFEEARSWAERNLDSTTFVQIFTPEPEEGFKDLYVPGVPAEIIDELKMRAMWSGSTLKDEVVKALKAETLGGWIGCQGKRVQVEDKKTIFRNGKEVKYIDLTTDEQNAIDLEADTFAEGDSWLADDMSFCFTKLPRFGIEIRKTVLAIRF